MPDKRRGRKYQKHPVEAYIEAAYRNKGNLMRIAEDLGVTYEAVHYRYKTNPHFREAVTRARFQLVNLAETQLENLILQGNVQAVLFALKTLGKEFGYTEKQEINLKTEGTESVKVKVILGKDGISVQQLPQEESDERTDERTDEQTNEPED